MKTNDTQVVGQLKTRPRRGQPLWRLFLCTLIGMTSLGTLHDAHAARAGQLDPTFGSGGKALIDFANNSDYGRAVALQADGKIVVVGYSGVYPSFNSALARLNSDGSLDTTFGNGGTVIAPFSTTDSLEAVAIQTDGKIVVVGSAAATSGNNGTDVLVARYNCNGTLDTTFGSSGSVITELRGNDIPKF